MAATEIYSEASKRAACGEWRRPRMKIYDYNQDYGGNYYQPMLHYVYSKEMEGPFHTRQEVRLPDPCEVVSDKYSNMRANDFSGNDAELERFLTKAYKKRINEVNSATAYARYELVRNSKQNSLLSPIPPLGSYLRDFYCRELKVLRDRKRQRDNLKL